MLDRWKARLKGVGMMAVMGCAAPLGAQVVEGRLLESVSARPVVAAGVALADTVQQVVATAVTDSTGFFRLTAPRAGSYFIRAEAVGYRTAVDGLLELGGDGFIEISFYITPVPIEIEGITATAERRRVERKLELTGFYERQKMGFGDHLDLEEIERRNAFDASQLLQGMIGIRVVRVLGGESVTCNGRSLRTFVDGVRVAVPAGDILRDVDAIAGLELYRHVSSLPLQYGGTNIRPGVCTLLVWTKGD